MKKLLYILLVVVGFACESTINPTLENAEKILVIDAWVNQKMERQEIRITRSQSYFDNTQPTKVAGAIVTVEDLNNGAIYTFQEGTDAYFWEPNGTPFGETGHQYRLTVTTNGETFEAQSTLGRHVAIDTIMFHHEEKNLLVREAHYEAEFFATDPTGLGDAYWIKTWKNDQYLGKPGEINIAVDGGFTASQAVDGQVFIQPIRRDLINPLDKVPDKQNEFLPPYLPGDKVYVEIHTIDQQAFDFLWAVYYHTNHPGGLTELFTIPLANAPTNIKNTQGGTTKVAGFFNVAAVSTKAQQLTQEIANQAQQK
ncbi:MAG TPA: hypothetical protein DCS93_40225 [Microscillaceae bacterium]|nr:hypothetical protein [Microscillaceae bacterium]